jgi:signal transduction histidine kinase
VVIAVRDEGRGMDKNVIDHIFEPFFTTKDQRNGTGLGLSICNNIVKSHNGSIEIDSKVGAGTTMSVVLPVSERTASVRA